MPQEKEIRDRADRILSVVALQIGALNDVLDPLVDMLKRSEDPIFHDLKQRVTLGEGMAKLDLLTDAATKIATAEQQTGGERYADENLLDKIRCDLLMLTAQVAAAQRDPKGSTH